jgi:ribose transport system substrate-binding protein
VGLSVEAGLTESDYAEAQLKRKMILSADRVVALVDSSKFGVVDLTSFATLGEVDRILTDSQLDPKRVTELRQTCPVITVCDHDSVTSFAPCEGDNRHLRIGFANLTETGISFAIDVRRGLERAAKAAGNIDLVLADNQLNGQIAMRVADELVARQVDLAIEYQIDEKMGSVIAEKFRRASIPVIAVDIPMLGATYFGVNNYSAGYPAGEHLGRWICEHWGGKLDRLLVLREERAGALVEARMQGQLDGLRATLGEFGAIKIIDIDSGNTAEVSAANTTAVLRALPPHLRIAFISVNDDAAIGAISAARALGREKTFMGVGQGGDRPAREELRRPDSLLLCTTAYMPENYGAKLLELAKRLLAREPLPPAVYCEHTLLTRDNIHQHYREPETLWQ